MNNKLRDDAKRYIESIYSSHREEDLKAWNRLIDILFLYFEQILKQHEEDKHG